VHSFFSRLPVVPTLITLLAVVIMFALGVWQLQRAENKQQRLIQIETAADSASLSLYEILSMHTEIRDLPLSVNAIADTQKYFLLDNKIQKGRVGYQVLVPLRTEQGWLIANFGWLRAPGSRQDLPQVELPTKVLNYQGVVAMPALNPMITETAIVDGNWPKVLQQIDLDVMQQHYKQTLLPIIVLLDPEPQSEFGRIWQAVVMPPEKHIAYAIQWFCLGLAALIIYIFAQRIKLRKEE
jgi:surfeit locus 1 family protein